MRKQKTATEISEIIRQIAGVDGLCVVVLPDEAFGWVALVTDASSNLMRWQRWAEDIAPQLRVHYDLASDHTTPCGVRTAIGMRPDL